MGRRSDKKKTYLVVIALSSTLMNFTLKFLKCADLLEMRVFWGGGVGKGVVVHYFVMS